MTLPPASERREFHRIRYPIMERPVFLHEERAHAVLDISARGLRYVIPGAPSPRPHQAVKGALLFRRGARIDIEGTVIRIQDQEVAMYLHREISFSMLLAEQRYLHTHYPMWS